MLIAWLYFLLFKPPFHSDNPFLLSIYLTSMYLDLIFLLASYHLKVCLYNLQYLLNKKISNKQKKVRYSVITYQLSKMFFVSGPFAILLYQPSCLSSCLLLHSLTYYYYCYYSTSVTFLSFFFIKTYCLTFDFIEMKNK